MEIWLFIQKNRIIYSCIFNMNSEVCGIMEKVFIFDMDGVIVNSEPIHHMIELEVASKYNIPLDKKRLEAYVGMRTRDVWELIIKEEKLSLKIGELLFCSEETKVKYIEKSDIQPISGIIELIKKLKELGYIIALASSSPIVLINAILNKFDIISYFECIVSGEEVNYGKPAPDIYLEAANRLNVQPKNCYVLEDSKMGVESATRAGMMTIGFLNSGSGSQDLSLANHIVNSIEEIIEAPFLKRI